MAVQNKPERPIQRPLQRTAQQQAAAPQRTVAPRRPSVQQAVAQARPATVNRNILNSARSVYTTKTPQKPVLAANAKYVAGPRPQLIKDITKENPNSSSGGLLSHGAAVDYLTDFLTRSGKIRHKP